MTECMSCILLKKSKVPLFSNLAKPRGTAALALGQGRLHLCDTGLITHPLTTLPRIDPYTTHLGFYFAKAIRPDTAAGSITKLLRTVHWAGHPGLAEHTTPAHPAVKHHALDSSFDRSDGFFNPRVTYPQPEWV